MKRRLSPRLEALAFRIWQVADPREWSVSLSELAAMLGEDVAELRRVCRRKGWLSRLAADEPRQHGGGRHVSRSTNPRWDDHPRATWRGVTPIDPISGVALLSFETEAGEVLRLRVDGETLRSLAEAASWALSASGKIGVSDDL